MEQRLARSRCYRFVFVFEHFFYSSARLILYSLFWTVNTITVNFFINLCITFAILFKSPYLSAHKM